MPVAELICVGTEHLLGEVVDTNSPYLCRKLKDLGVCVYHKSLCGDSAPRLRDVFLRALSRADLVILIGGLGPTEDDLTRECVCACLGLQPVEDPAIRAKLEAYFAARGRAMAKSNLKQALVPEGAQILENENGTAPGLWIERDGKAVALLPGPPKEFCPMADHELLPRIAARFKSAPIVTKTLRLYGIGESELSDTLSAFWGGIGDVTLADYVKDGEIDLRLACRGEENAANRKIADAIGRIYPLIAPYVYASGADSLPETLVRRFSKRNLRFATAESCTGGLIAQLITDVPGASGVFWGGAVSYSPDSKRRMLGVDPETIDTFGAVSHETAREMAFGALELSGADLALSVTGLAGPDGDGKNPVGTVVFGLAARENDGTVNVKTDQKRFVGPRERVRRLAALYGIALALKETNAFSIESEMV